jgi:hypothetical protein
VTAGDPEPTEYEGYTEAVEYEQYGEVLLEHDGGDGRADSNQASGYHEAAGDQEPTDVDNAQEVPLVPDIVEVTPPVDFTEPTSEQPAEEEDHFSEGGDEGEQTSQGLVNI